MAGRCGNSPDREPNLSKRSDCERWYIVVRRLWRTLHPEQVQAEPSVVLSHLL